MKKVFLSLVMASAVVLASAQISQTPIQSFNDNLGAGFVFNYSNGEQVIIRHEYGDWLINIYDLSFNLKKSINLSAIQGIHGYGIQTFYISEGRDQTSDLGLLVTEKIFNNDELLEIIVMTTDGFAIVNENGVEVFRKRYTAQIMGYEFSNTYFSLLETKNGNLLAVEAEFYNNNSSWYSVIEYYALPGYTAPPSNVRSATISQLGNPYPNPARTFIKLPYELPYGVNAGTIRVFDAQGRLINTMRVNGREEFVRLDTTSLSAGNYFFTLETRGEQSESKPFIVVK